MNLLHEAYRVWALRREFHSAVAELSAYSDRQLDDLGIGRGDIARIAYEEAERRVGAPHSAPVAAKEWRRPMPAASS